MSEREPDFAPFGPPRVSDLADLVGSAEYVEAGIRWRVFEDLAVPGARGRNVLIVLGDRWTLLDAAQFRRLAERILPQL